MGPCHQASAVVNFFCMVPAYTNNPKLLDLCGISGNGQRAGVAPVAAQT